MASNLGTISFSLSKPGTDCYFVLLFAKIKINQFLRGRDIGFLYFEEFGVSVLLFSFFFFLSFVFLGLHLRLMEVLRLGVKSELQLPAYATAAETQDPSHVCNLQHSSQQCQILNPLRKDLHPYRY